MTQEQIYKIHNYINRLLEVRYLAKAFDFIKYNLSRDNLKQFLPEIEKMENTYRYMLKYLSDGYIDESKNETINEIVSKLRVINDIMKREFIISDSPDSYSSALRYERIKNSSLESRFKELESAIDNLKNSDEATKNEAIKSYENASDALFNFVWTMFDLSEKNYMEILPEIFNNQNIPEEIKADVISAILLGNLSYFDPYAINFLINLYESNQNKLLRTRSLVAIILILAVHNNRIKEESKILTRIKMWQDSPEIISEIKDVVLNLIKTHDTQRISSKMQNEIIPELMKMRPEILNRLKNLSNDSENSMLDMNPEWEDLLDKNGIGDKLRELTDIQLEGGDVMMPAFSNLKNYPFFNRISNWFMPFNINRSELKDINNSYLEKMDPILRAGSAMCDSDKYSFFLSLSMMPETQKKIMSEKMNEQMQQINEELSEHPKIKTDNNFRQESLNYIRDLYRFFKLYKKKNDFKDPFIHPLPIFNLPVISDILGSEGLLSPIAEFYFNHGYYAEALPVFLAIEKDSIGDCKIWEKIGYCYNALKELDNAIIWYKKAELLNPDSIWLTKKLALASRLLNRFNEAIEYYEKALEAEPENYHLLMSAANCYLEAGKYDMALTHFYHAAYLKPEKTNPEKAIAWTELMAGNLNKSFEIYERLINQGKADHDDFINMGHISVINRDIRNGIYYYLKALNMMSGDMVKLRDAILKDLNIFKNRDIHEEDIRLVLDMVSYEATNPLPK